MRRMMINGPLCQLMSYQMVKKMNKIVKIKRESMSLILIPEVAMICLRGIVMLDMRTGELKMKYTL